MEDEEFLLLDDETESDTPVSQEKTIPEKLVNSDSKDIISSISNRLKRSSTELKSPMN